MNPKPVIGLSIWTGAIGCEHKWKPRRVEMIFHWRGESHSPAHNSLSSVIGKSRMRLPVAL